MILSSIDGLGLLILYYVNSLNFFSSSSIIAGSSSAVMTPSSPTKLESKTPLTMLVAPYFMCGGKFFVSTSSASSLLIFPFLSLSNTLKISDGLTLLERPPYGSERAASTLSFLNSSILLPTNSATFSSSLVSIILSSPTNSLLLNTSSITWLKSLTLLNTSEWEIPPSLFTSAAPLKRRWTILPPTWIF